MPSTEPQRRAHRFLSERLQSLEPFTKEELRQATGWSTSTLNTHWSKQFKSLLEPVDGTRFRVKERFRPYLDWKKFRNLVTQVKTVSADYEPTVFENIIVYEFYMPLAHENALRVTLDSLFFKDAIVPRLRRIGFRDLQQFFARLSEEQDDDAYIERVCNFVEAKFGGYSIYHVDGRFRASKLSTQDEVLSIQKSGQRYLIDETTAVTRFIFPCKEDEPDKVRFLFKKLFIDSITQLVSGEDEIWMVESGMRNRVHIWRPSDN